MQARKQRYTSRHEVIEIQGTISGEHGTGLSRTWFMQEQYGPLYNVFRQIKNMFDPQGILNPDN